MFLFVLIKLRKDMCANFILDSPGSIGEAFGEYEVWGSIGIKVWH